MHHPLLNLSLAVVVSLLLGCQSNPQRTTDGDKPFDDLYDGKSKLVYGTIIPAGSVQEAAGKGDMALNKGDLDLALFHYLQALEMDPKHYQTLYKVGAIHYSRGTRQLALLAYQEVLKLEANHAGALEGVGLIRLSMRQHEAAKDFLEKAVQSDSTRWRSHNALGILMDLQGDYAAAQNYYQTALQISPGSARVLNNMGYSKYTEGNWDDAMQYLHQALQYDPKFERARMNLGLIYTRRGEYESALDVFQEQVDAASAHNIIGYISLVNGDYDIAENYLLRAIKLSPTYHVEANRNLKVLERMRGANAQEQRDAVPTAAIDSTPATYQNKAIKVERMVASTGHASAGVQSSENVIPAAEKKVMVSVNAVAQDVPEVLVTSPRNKELALAPIEEQFPTHNDEIVNKSNYTTVRNNPPQISGIAMFLTQDSERYTIQLLTSKSEQYVREFIKRNKLGNNAVYFKSGIGADQFSLIYGSYTAQKQAKESIETLPRPVLQHSPWVRSISTVRQALDDSDSYLMSLEDS